VKNPQAVCALVTNTGIELRPGCFTLHQQVFENDPLPQQESKNQSIQRSRLNQMERVHGQMVYVFPTENLNSRKTEKIPSLRNQGNSS